MCKHCDLNPATSPFKAEMLPSTLGTAFFEEATRVESGFGNGTKSKYLCIVLETRFHPSHSCHTATIVKYSSSLSVGIESERAMRGGFLLNRDHYRQMGLMLCEASRCSIIVYLLWRLLRREKALSELCLDKVFSLSSA